ncbi:hypothetical protein [Chitinophaga filiformis]|uniref:Uncharacterized protein n=1 Tax=Chitinophaga filiformis TaxID=104663 RepID=A0A1G7MEE7_CHIFI|nr:hypothetical protein [Chitinophaga filiformis]SDF60055.1 hypothetical protein SAMN04488121_102391 [Chitinophaga filiformis]
MIYESEHWKKDLLKFARKLTKRKHSATWEERDYCDFEKELMIGFYIIRKLSDAGKLSDTTLEKKLSGRKIPSRNKIIHRLNAHRYQESFDFAKAEAIELDLIFVANQLIHSYVLAHILTKMKSAGVIYF